MSGSRMAQIVGFSTQFRGMGEAFAQHLAIFVVIWDQFHEKVEVRLCGVGLSVGTIEQGDR